MTGTLENDTLLCYSKLICTLHCSDLGGQEGMQPSVS